MTFDRWRTVVLLGALGLSGSLFGGCALILGIEKRTEGEELPGVVDDETQIRTTELCIEYCDTVIANCLDENAQYTARSSCINTCNALPEGSDGEPFGNTVHCRLVRANGASSLPDEECDAAGPGGDGSCGSNCDAWCHMLESECSTDFSALADCQAACATIPDSGNFDIEASYDKHDVQCRLIHLGAVAGDPTVHCNHARYVAVDFCDAGGGGELTCERTCDVIMGNCTGENAVYESRDECLTACAVFPLGSQADLVENTVGCRLYHGTSGGLDPGTHCDHAGPTGDGHCGEENEPEETGPCNSYCMLMEAGCPAEFTADFGDFPACQSACATELEDRGAKPDALYTVDTARDEDGLQCRAYYLVKALAGDATACARVSLSATCE